MGKSYLCPYADKYICMVQGNTLAFGVEFEGLDQDLDSAYFTCRASLTAAQPLFQKSLNNGITKVETGKYRVRVAPTDTANIAAGKYYYNFEIGVNSDVYTVIKGILEIQENITT